MRVTNNITGNPLYQKVTSYTIDAIMPIFVLGEDDTQKESQPRYVFVVQNLGFSCCGLHPPRASSSFV